MNIPAIPTSSGQSLSGRVSWFGGPNDGETGNKLTASGALTSTPGIAIYNRATLGGYWRVTDTKTGRSAVLRQTDLGPAPWTGRKIDITYSALNRFGYSEHNFPTDSPFKAEYLGHTPQAAATIAPVPGAGKLPSVPGLNQGAFRQAQQRSMLGRLMAAGGEKTASNPLFATGLLTTKAPNPANFMQAASGAPKTVAAPAGPASPTGGSGGGAGAVAFGTSHVGKDAESQGQNLGPELDKLESTFGMKGEPWCAMFATTAAAQGGAPTSVRTASVAEIRQWASSGTHGYMYGLLSPTKARPGDLLVFGDQHVALVKNVGPQGITTLEGNADGSGGVVELHHSFTEGQIARPNYLGGKR